MRAWLWYAVAASAAVGVSLGAVMAAHKAVDALRARRARRIRPWG